MKRYGNLYSQIADYDNLRLAHKNAQKGKRHYPEVQKVNAREDEYLAALQRQLQDMSFKNSEYETFIKRGAKKERLIYKLPYYPDRIVHHAVMNVCEPIWQRSMIRDTYAALKGRGIHDGVRRFKGFLQDRPGTMMCYKFDIAKFYPSIDNNILADWILPLKIKCKQTLALLREVVFSTDGLPIGNFLSQIFGNLFLTPFDWFMKQVQKVRYYARYCDDIVVLHSDKALLRDLAGVTQEWLAENLRLGIKGNWQIFPRLQRPIDFLGYVFCDGYTLVRKDIVKRFKRRIQQIRQNWRQMPVQKIVNTLMSYYGWFLHANAWGLWNKYVDNEIRCTVDTVCRNNGLHNPLRRIYA